MTSKGAVLNNSLSLLFSKKRPVVHEVIRLYSVRGIDLIRLALSDINRAKLRYYIPYLLRALQVPESANNFLFI